MSYCYLDHCPYFSDWSSFEVLASVDQRKVNQQQKSLKMYRLSSEGRSCKYRQDRTILTALNLITQQLPNYDYLTLKLNRKM